MPDPLIDLSKLKAIKEWSEDLADELQRDDVLPCRNTERLGDCITKQRRYLLEEMKPSKMCNRCKSRWYVMMAAKEIANVYSTKTDRDKDSPPDFS